MAEAPLGDKLGDKPPFSAVIDTSAMVELVTGSSLRAAVARAVQPHRLMAPGVLDVEVLGAIRGLWQGGKLTDDEANDAVERLIEAPVMRVPTNTRRQIEAAWRLRHNVSSADAFFIGVAEQFELTLITLDRGQASNYEHALVPVP
jgi:predicted nucleic acid-binding protein